MQEKTIVREEKVYTFNQEEKEEILRRIVTKRQSDLSYYWDYNDRLSEEQVLKYIKGELEDIDIIETDYEMKIIEDILQEELTAEEKTDNELQYYLCDEMRILFDMNFQGLLNNSRIRLRIELKSNEDMITISQYKYSECYKELKKLLKGNIKLKELKNELLNMMGSEYGEFVFFWEVRGSEIETLRNEYEKGYITIPKNCGCGIFNFWVGAGSLIDLRTRAEIKLNLKDWSNSDKKYFSVAVKGDKLSKYGIQETYNLTYECWRVN